MLQKGHGSSVEGSAGSNCSRGWESCSRGDEEEGEGGEEEGGLIVVVVDR